MSLLKIDNLVKSYKGRKVVKDASFCLNSSEVIGLLGPNGAGKSTCFDMVLGLIPIEAGRITLDKDEITNTPSHIRGKLGIGYLPQGASLFRELTVSDNILAILQMRKDLNRHSCQTCLETLIDEFNLSNIRNQKAMVLSGGERRRVEIARALAINPKFILLDEPFAGIDPVSIHSIKENISMLKQRGIGVLITDHDVRNTLDICDNSYVLYGGMIIAQGNAESILNNNKVKDVYLGHQFTL